MRGRATCQPASFRSPDASRRGNAPAPPCGRPLHGAIPRATRDPQSTALSEPAPRTWPETRPQPRAGLAAPRDRPEAPPAHAGATKLRNAAESRFLTKQSSNWLSVAAVPCIVILLTQPTIGPFVQRTPDRSIKYCSRCGLVDSTFSKRLVAGKDLSQAMTPCRVQAASYDKRVSFAGLPTKAVFREIGSICRELVFPIRVQFGRPDHPWFTRIRESRSKCKDLFLLLAAE